MCRATCKRLDDAFVICGRARPYQPSFSGLSAPVGQDKKGGPSPLPRAPAACYLHKQRSVFVSTKPPFRQLCRLSELPSSPISSLPAVVTSYAIAYAATSRLLISCLRHTELLSLILRPLLPRHATQHFRRLISRYEPSHRPDRLLSLLVPSGGIKHELRLSDSGWRTTM